jgi:hypothetical protein
MPISFKAKTAASIAAQNTFSNPVELCGTFNVSLSGTWSATVHLQRSFDSGATWLDVQSLSANAELTGDEPERGVLYRFGVKTGGYTSGTVIGRLSQ